MIYTSNYKTALAFNKAKTYSISWDKGKDANYDGAYYSALAPKKEFFNIWKNNKDKISDEENNRYYIEEYYNQILSKLNPEEVYQKLNNSVLLCYENSEEFCHRHIVAAWIELLLGIKIPEIIIEDNNIKTINDIEYYKIELEKVMKEKIDMNDFNSLRALYLFNKSTKLKREANSLENFSTSKIADNLRKAASLLHIEALKEENSYNQKLSYKKKREKK